MSATGSSADRHSLVKQLLGAIWLTATTLGAVVLYLWAGFRAFGFSGAFGTDPPDPTIAPPYTLLSGVIAASGPATIWFFTRKRYWLFLAGVVLLLGLVLAIATAVATLN